VNEAGASVTRQWRARATPEGALAYSSHLSGSVLPQLQALAGFRGVTLLNRPVAGEVEITVQTRWDNMAAIAAFAQPELEAAVVEPAAAAVLLSYDDLVTHHQVILEG
jgi:heme-degrading monooxygenase HmoA